MSMLEVTILSLTFLVCLLIVWTSLRVGITPVPSSRKARRAILAVSELADAGTIIELGSGWGHLALALAKKYPHRQVIGYELSVIPWLVSLISRQLQGIDNLILPRKNFLNCEFPQSTLLVCYLYPGGMKKLAEKLQREKNSFEMLISNTFALPGTEPEQVIRLDDFYRSPIYIYRFDKREDSDVEK